jgi:hypothetical protein
LFGGWEGAARGAGVASEQLGKYQGSVAEAAKNKKAEEFYKAQKSEERAYEEKKSSKELAGKKEIEEAKQRQENKFKMADIAIKLEELGMKRESEGVKARMKALDIAAKGAKSQAGRALPAKASENIAELRAGLSGGVDLVNFITKNQDKIGPIIGRKADIPVAGRYTDQAKIQSYLDSHRQFLGKAAEGGVLRKDDWDKYGILLPTVNDTPETAVQKIQTNNRIIERLLEQKLEAYSSAGYDMSKFGVKPMEFQQPESSSITRDEATDLILELTE